MTLSERWFRLLQRLYPPDFRDEMGDAVVEAYMDRARDALKRRRRRSGSCCCGCARLSTRCATARPSACAPRPRGGAAATGAAMPSSSRAGSCARRSLPRTTIGTLTVGLGMFAVVYTAVQKILIDPMPYKDPGDLYYVWRDYGPILDLKRATGRRNRHRGAAEDRRRHRGRRGAAAVPGGIFALREGADPMEIAVTRTSPNLFDLLGVAPALGRGFAPDEVGPAARQVIVLTHGLWNRLGADPGIVGTDVRLQGRPYTVIGVLPPDFTFVRNEAAGPPQRVDAYHPVRRRISRRRIANGAYAALIRARRGASPEAVAAAVDAVGRAVDARDFNSRGLKLYPVGLKADVVSRIRPALVVLGAAGLVLVLMLMVNLASVLLARAAQREHEVAVSRALGANTVAIVRATLLEGGLLGLAGGALGALAAIWGTRALVALAPLDLPRREAIAIDWRIAAVVIAVGALLGVLAATVPAAWAARASLSSLLAGSAVRGGGGHGRLRRGMIVAQVALSLVLLSSGALVVRSFERLLRADPGLPAGRRAHRARADAAGVLSPNERCHRVPGPRPERAGRDSRRHRGERRLALPLTARRHADDDQDSRRAREHRRRRAGRAARRPHRRRARTMSK